MSQLNKVYLPQKVSSSTKFLNNNTSVGQFLKETVSTYPIPIDRNLWNQNNGLRYDFEPFLHIRIYLRHTLLLKMWLKSTFQHSPKWNGIDQSYYIRPIHIFRDPEAWGWETRHILEQWFSIFLGVVTFLSHIKFKITYWYPQMA